MQNQVQAVSPSPPFEDELGDVLEKAARHLALNYEQIGRLADVELSRIRDAVDYRSELTTDELTRLARVLGLNEVGLCALASGKYPRPALKPLPFEFHTLRMPFGVGVVNAYLAACGDTVLLFDCGASFESLLQVWPARIRTLTAVFVTHYEAEHIGGLETLLERFGLEEFYGPASGRWIHVRPMTEGQQVEKGRFRVTSFQSPGHAPDHNCYRLELPTSALNAGVLISGDLIFAGSLGGGYFCCGKQLDHSRRITQSLPGDTLLAPGHGPLSTVGIEKQFNPFLP